MIKLVVSDLDGTLFGRDTVVPQEAPALVQRLRDAGIGFTIASGRAEWFVEPIARKLGTTCPYLACNGGTMIEEGRALRRMQFPLHAIREVSARAQALGLTVIYTIMGKERVTDLTDWMRRDAEKTGVPYIAQPFSEAEWASQQAEKTLYHDPAQSGIIAEIEAMLKNTDTAYTRYQDRAIEVTEKSVNKAAGLSALLSFLHLEAKDVMVIGDDQNDIEILKMAGVGVAVANASPDAKAAADYVCRAERFAGIQEAVEAYCFPPQGTA